MMDIVRPSDDRIACARRVAASLDTAFIGDDFHRAAAERMATFNPYDGSTLADVALGDDAIVDHAVRVARATLDGEWGCASAGARAQYLRTLAEGLAQRADEFALLETLDVGKPIAHSTSDDVPTAVGVLRWFASLTETYYDSATQRQHGIVGSIVREPRGVVGVVLPWNYPLTTLALKIAPAIAAGNTIVAKPAEDTPLTTLRLAQLAIELGLPSGVLNVVPGRGHIAGRAIGLHAGIDAVNFTGSTEIGRHFLRYSADSNLKEVSLECGGKNPALILPDVRALDRFADTLGIGFMMNSGQLCSSISRILVPRALTGQLRDLLADQMAAWPVGDPIDPATRIGPMINAEQASNVTAAFEAGRTRHDDVVISDAPRTGASDRIVTPAVFFDVDPTSDLWREEIFGPILSVRAYDTVAEAIQSANDTAYGLSAYVFSDSPALVNSVAARLDAGFVSVNAFGEGDFSTPFGGFKLSGFGGKDKGIQAIDQYSRVKSVWWETSPSAETEQMLAH